MGGSVPLFWIKFEKMLEEIKSSLFQLGVHLSQPNPWIVRNLVTFFHPECVLSKIVSVELRRFTEQVEDLFEMIIYGLGIDF